MYIGKNRAFGDLIRKVAHPLATLTRNKVNKYGTPVLFTSLASAKIRCHSISSVTLYFSFVHFDKMEIIDTKSQRRIKGYLSVTLYP